MLGSVFKKSFSPAKCKTLLKLASSRIKLLRNKREVQLKQLKRELAKLLETNQEPTAQFRVELIHREQNILAAYDIIELLCEMLAVRLPIITSQKQCPIDLREAVGTIIYAAPRCSDLPELQKIRSLFSAKYGKEFTAIAAELRPDCGVNRVVVEKLSAKGPPMDVKLKLMKDIATEHGLDWDPTALESQNLKPPEDLLDGPSRFFGASQASVQSSFKESSSNEPLSPLRQSNMVAESKTHVVQNTEFSQKEKQFIPFIRPRVEEDDPASSDSQFNLRTGTMQRQSSSSSYSSHGLTAHYASHSLSDALSHKYDDEVDFQHPLQRRMSLKHVANAAHAAAESAEQAAAAARAAALLARKQFERSRDSGTSSDSESDDGVAVSQAHDESSEDEHLNLGRAPPRGDSSTLRAPLSDEPLEERGFHSMHSSEKNHWNHGESREQQSASHPIFRTESQNFDVIESPAPATKNPERHVSDQASGQWQNSSNSFSNNGHWQRDYTRSRSFETAGAATPSFNTHEWDDPSIEPAEETPHSGPPERPPPQPPGAQLPRLTKATSFVHPKLPDYDDLTAHFQALKATRSRR